MVASFTIKRAVETDWDEVLDIWSARPKLHADTDEQRIDLGQQLAGLESPFGCWVAKQDAVILGWVSLVPVCRGLGFEEGGVTGELSCYIAPDVRAKGLGSALMKAAVKSALRGELDWIIGWIAESNVGCKRISEVSGGRFVTSFPARPKNPSRGTLEMWRWDCEKLKMVDASRD